MLAALAAAVVAILTLCPAPAVAQAHAEQSITPPLVNGQPVKVAIGLVITNLAQIDVANEQFLVDGYLFMRWRDPRLAHPPTPGNLPQAVDPALIWRPELEFVNAVKPRERQQRRITADAAGEVRYVERFDAELSSKFFLRNFPFDTQTLQIDIHPFPGGDMQTVDFVLDRELTWKSSEFKSYSSLAEWNVAAMTAVADRVKVVNGLEISELRFEVKVVRRYGFYLWKVFLPLLLMVLLSWTVFWMETFDLQNQIQVAVITLLTVIAFALAISSNLPRVPYLTFSDAFFLTCYVFVFIAILELMTVHVTHRIHGKDVGLRIRRISRWLVPCAFCVTLAIIFYRFLI
ncbi:MAG TPA: hypothetical protein VMD75_12705 [Candidatus Binataceae bacterium]|nr:hypothetical protein [Candidatus Binataceae bacterium]